MMVGMLTTVIACFILLFSRTLPAAQGRPDVMADKSGNLQVYYPLEGVALVGNDNVIQYRGVITVRVYPATAAQSGRYVPPAVQSDDLTPGKVSTGTLAAGNYEVHLTAHYNDEVRTVIQRNVVVTGSKLTTVITDVGPHGEALIVGDSKRTQQIANDLVTLRSEVRTLRDEIVALRRQVESKNRRR